MTGEKRKAEDSVAPLHRECGAPVVRANKKIKEEVKDEKTVVKKEDDVVAVDEKKTGLNKHEDDVVDVKKHELVDALRNLIKGEKVLFANKLLSLIEAGDVQIIDTLTSKIAMLTPDVAVCEQCDERFDRLDGDTMCKPTCRVNEWDDWETIKYHNDDWQVKLSGKCIFCSKEMSAECPSEEAHLYLNGNDRCSKNMKHKERPKNMRYY